MREMGVRELKATLSEVLRAVDSGNRVRITLRGRPVADIVPAQPTPAPQSWLERMVAEGRITPATRPKPAHPPEPGKLLPGMTASEFVIAEREAER